MTPVTPSLAYSAHTNFVQASQVSFALTSRDSMFDWSKGAAKKNATRITVTNLPSLPSPSTTLESAKSKIETEFADRFSGADLPTKVFLFLQAANEHLDKVPELLAREARQLNAVEFAQLMSAIQESGSLWSEAGSYSVFNYSSGSVGCVWLGGCEVYNSIWKNY
jgi:hypothetical protein